MRTPKSLSYSSLSLFEKDIEEFYMRYLADKAAPRLPQEPPMAVGSAFDAYVKSELSWALYGSAMSSQFEFGTIFESQVEPQCRDFALKAGKHCFKSFKFCGGYKDLLDMLQKSIEPPRFEFTLTGTVGGAPFLGKPDVRFVLDLGEGRISVIDDFKVHGYCSKYGASPTKGYRLCRDAYKTDKPSRSHMKEHTNYLAMNFRGLEINSGYMEGCSKEYADQLCLYGWLLGEKVGDENVVLMLDELVAKYMDGNPPLLRVANHRGRVSTAHQLALEARVAKCWNTITSGHVFQEMSLEDSKARCEVLDGMSDVLMSDGGKMDNFFMECVRKPKW
jgi:hypothetical protein